MARGGEESVWTGKDAMLMLKRVIIRSKSNETKRNRNVAVGILMDEGAC